MPKTNKTILFGGLVGGLAFYLNHSLQLGEKRLPSSVPQQIEVLKSNPLVPHPFSPVAAARNKTAPQRMPLTEKIEEQLAAIQQLMATQDQETSFKGRDPVEINLQFYGQLSGLLAELHTSLKQQPHPHNKIIDETMVDLLAMDSGEVKKASLEILNLMAPQAQYIESIGSDVFGSYHTAPIEPAVAYLTRLQGAPRQEVHQLFEQTLQGGSLFVSVRLMEKLPLYLKPAEQQKYRDFIEGLPPNPVNDPLIAAFKRAFR